MASSGKEFNKFFSTMIFDCEIFNHELLACDQSMWITICAIIVEWLPTLYKTRSHYAGTSHIENTVALIKYQHIGGSTTFLAGPPFCLAGSNNYWYLLEERTVLEMSVLILLGNIWLTQLLWVLSFYILWSVWSVSVVSATGRVWLNILYALQCV